MEIGAITHQHYPPRYGEFLALFAGAHYIEAHDVLEALWREDPQHFYKGLIQFAVGLHHWSRKNAKGAGALLSRAENHLRPYEPAYLGLDVAAALAQLVACRREVAVGAEWRPVFLRMLDEDAAGPGVTSRDGPGS